MRRRKILAISMLFFLIVSNLPIFGLSGEKTDINCAKFFKNQSIIDKINYEPHDPIRINGEDEFTSENGVRNGNGSKENPYIIENLEIDGGGYGYCIYIGNTSCHFKIINCKLYNASGKYKLPYYTKSGLIFYNLTNGSIENTKLFNNGFFGIHLIKSICNNISYNEIFDNEADGIYLQNSEESVLYGNKIYSHKGDGIYLENSIHNNITKNRVSSNFRGIHLSNSYNNSISNNVFKNKQNAKDDGLNIWNISAKPGKNIINGTHLGGNYWSDYKGVDYDNDSLGNEYLPYTPPLPYNCSGFIKNGGDSLPLVLPPNWAPVARFTREPSKKIINISERIKFDASLSYDRDEYRGDYINNYTWDFGDGNKAYGKIVYHSYSEKGVYNVTLLIKDSIGAYNFTTKQISVEIKHSYVEIVKPMENSIYIRNLLLPIPFLGKIVCDYVTKIANLTPIKVYAIAIGEKLTVKANVVLAENQTCKEVEFYRGTHLICVDDESPYECTFEIDETTLYYITVTAVCTDFMDSPTIHILVSPNLFTLFRDFLNSS